MQKLVDILESSAQEWLSVESKLLESNNVNLAAKEVYVPLKRLTTTLEVLGNILYSHNDLENAVRYFERACPLMELLPPDAVSSEYSSWSSKDSGEAVDSAQLGKFSTVGYKSETGGVGKQTELQAAGCFNRLRELYYKLNMGRAKSEIVPISILDKEEEDRRRDGGSNTEPGEQGSSTVIGSQLPNNKFLLSSGKNREYNLKYVLSQRQQRQTLLQKRYVEMRSNEIHDDGAVIESDESDAPRHRRRDHSLLVAEDSDSIYSDGRDLQFDIEKRLMDLRIPFQHLRGDHQNNEQFQLSLRDKNEENSVTTTSPSTISTTTPTASTQESLRTPRPGAGIGLGLSGGASSGDSGLERISGISGVELNAFSGFDITVPGVSTILIADDLEQLLRKFVKGSKKIRKKLAQQTAKYFDELDINFPNMDYNEYAANMDVGQAYLEVMGRAAEEGFGFIEQELNSWKLASSSEENFDDQNEVLLQVGEKGDGDESEKNLVFKSDASSASVENAETVIHRTSALSSKRLKGTRVYPTDHTIGALEEKYGLKHRNKAFGQTATDGSNARLSHVAPRTMQKAVPKLTMAEKNRLLVLYAFDIINTDPTDPFIVALGFNKGIVANDRSRRADTDMTAPPEALINQAVESLRDILHNIEAGVQSSNSDDAHRRIFGENSSNNLNEVWNLQAAEEYLSAKRDALRAQLDRTKENAATGDSDGSTGRAKSSKRRRHRQQAVSGQGEYSVSSDPSIDPFSPTASKIHSDSSVFDSFYTEEGSRSASLFSSSPSFTSSESTDLLLAIFFLFLAAVLGWVYLTNQDAARKRMAAGRNRFRPGGVHAGNGSSGRKNAAAQWMSGTWIVDLMYAQLGGVSGAPGANATADWDDEGLALSVAAGSARIANSNLSSNSSSSAQDGSGAGCAQSSSMLSKLNAWLFQKSTQDVTYSATANHRPSAPISAAPVKNKRNNKDTSTVMSQDSNSQNSTPGPTIPSLFGDLFALIKPPKTKDLSLDLDFSQVSRASVAELQPLKRKDSPRSDQPNEFTTRSPHPVTSHSGALHTLPISAGGGGGAISSGRKKGKTKDVTAHTKTSSSKPVISTSSVPRSVPSSDSLNSKSSTSSNNSDSNGDSFVPPLVLNNRKVSWAGLIPNSTSTTTSSAAALPDTSVAPSTWYSTSDARAGAGAGIEDPGDWAEARKKGGRHKQNANEDAQSSSAKPERIALSLKDSPLFKSPAQRKHSAKSASTLQQKLHAPGPSPPLRTDLPDRKNLVSGNGTGIKPSVPPLYALSDAKLIAEKQGGWSVGSPQSYGGVEGSGAVATAGTSQGPVPPGLGQSGTSSRAKISSPPVTNQSSPSTSGSKPLFAQVPVTTAASPSSSIAGNSTTRTAFGFSQFDINRNSIAAQPSAYSSLWATVSSNQTHSSTGITEIGDISSSYIASESPSDLPIGLVDFLDSSPRNSPLPPDNASLYSSTYDFSSNNFFPKQDSYNKIVQQKTDQNSDYFSPFGSSFGKYDPDTLSGDLRSRYEGSINYSSELPVTPGDNNSWLMSTTVQSRRRGTNAAAPSQPVSKSVPIDMSTNITQEAFTVSGLSPDAPSFKPSQHRAQPPVNSTPQFLTDLATSSEFHNSSFATSGLQSANGFNSNSAPLYVSDDYYESFLMPGIDSILGGLDEQLDQDEELGTKKVEEDVGVGMEWELDVDVDAHMKEM